MLPFITFLYYFSWALIDYFLFVDIGQKCRDLVTGEAKRLFGTIPDIGNNKVRVS